MPTIDWSPEEDRYLIYRRGTVVSRHASSSAAKKKGKQLGRKHGEPVSYRGPRMNDSKWIWTPPENHQATGGQTGSSNGGGFFASFFG